MYDICVYSLIGTVFAMWSMVLAMACASLLNDDAFECSFQFFTHKFGMCTSLRTSLLKNCQFDRSDENECSSVLAKNIRKSARQELSIE